MSANVLCAHKCHLAIRVYVGAVIKRSEPGTCRTMQGLKRQAASPSRTPLKVAKIETNYDEVPDDEVSDEFIASVLAEAHGSAIARVSQEERPEQDDVSDETIELIRESLAKTPPILTAHEEAHEIIKKDKKAALVYTHILYNFTWSKKMKEPYKRCISLLDTYKQTPWEQRKASTVGSKIPMRFRKVLDKFLDTPEASTIQSSTKHTVNCIDVEICTINGISMISLHKIANVAMHGYDKPLRQVWRNAGYGFIAAPALPGICEIKQGRRMDVFADKTGYQKFVSFLHPTVRENYKNFLEQVGALLGLENLGATSIFQTIQLGDTEFKIVINNGVAMISLMQILNMFKVNNPAVYISMQIKPRLHALGVPILNAEGQPEPKPEKMPRVEDSQELICAGARRWSKGMRLLNTGWYIDFYCMLLIIPWLKTPTNIDFYRRTLRNMLKLRCMDDAEPLFAYMTMDDWGNPIFSHLHEFASTFSV